MRTRIALGLMAIATATATVAAMEAPVPRPNPARTSQSTVDTILVLRVVDGDTIDVRMADGTTERVRVHSIDAPETYRPRCDAEREAGEAATAALYAATFGPRAVVRVTPLRRDRYGRIVGIVTVGGEDVGDLLVEAGVAVPWRGRREPAATWCGGAS